jgi:hypothetical protein
MHLIGVHLAGGHIIGGHFTGIHLLQGSISRRRVSQACILEAAVPSPPIEQATRPAGVLCGMGWRDQVPLNGSVREIIIAQFFRHINLELIQNR